MQSKILKGSITSVKKSVVLDVSGYGSVGVQVVGTFSATLQFQGSIDGITWYPILFRVPSTGIRTSSTTTTGLFISTISGIKELRVSCSAFTSGTAEVTVVTSESIDEKKAEMLTPKKVALARTVDATISTSTEITLNAATTFIRVYAIDKDVYMKWGTADVTAANFDEVIPANQVCDFYVPYESGATLYTAVNFIERAATGGIIVIEK